MKKKAGASVFDRMAETETFASFAKKKHSRLSSRDESSKSTGNGNINRKAFRKVEYQKPTSTTPSFFNRLAETETYASLKLKGDHSTVSTSTSTTSTSSSSTLSTISRGRIYKPTSTSNSFFDRLAETETYASKKLKGKDDLDTLDSKKKKKGPSKKTTAGFFERISKAETVSSTQRKMSKLDRVESLSMERASGVRVPVLEVNGQ